MVKGRSAPFWRFHGIHLRRTYLERFFASRVSESDIPDQPTLQYIRKITQSGFEAKEFDALYLSSFDKLTGPLNKVIQFAPLIILSVSWPISTRWIQAIFRLTFGATASLADRSLFFCSMVS
jgi:hypothetical protein